ncbi:MAG TPA: TonB-dependent receptor [Allosphingosinicella sp.]
MIAALLAGTASTALQAQETVKPAAPALPASGQGLPAPAPAATAPAHPEPAEAEAPPKSEFMGADGQPLPPELQRQLEEQIRNNPPPPVKRNPPPPAGPDLPTGAGGKDIVVTGQRPRGSVIGDIPPERTLNPLDIRAYGANDIGELIQTLGPQVSSDRGREDGDPVVLLNGKRVSSFAEIAKFPTEAIERMEIFPEELSLKYGYRADQKVVNVVTLERFSSRVGLLTYAVPTEGGRDTARIDANYLVIRGDTRFNFDADYGRSGSLLESERTVRQAPGGPDLGRFRTLLPATERLALSGTVSGNVLGEVASTLNGRFESNESESLLGPGPTGPLIRDTDTRLIHLGTALSGMAGKWLWSFTGNYDRIRTDTFTDTNDVLGTRDEARSVNSLADAELLLSGAVLTLPPGPLSMSVRGGIEMRDFSSRSLRGGVEQSADLSRDRAAIQASFDLPIASRRRKVLDRVGDLSANANFEIEELSDLGTLRTFGYGFNWSPIKEINFIASVTDEDGAPTVEQLGGPLVVTPNVRTYDFTRQEVTDITRVFGGNPGLRPDDRHVFSLGVNARPFGKADFNLIFEYTKTRIDDPIAAFPIATPEIEAAFPERFTRDIDGRLLRIDSRPLNFRRSDQEQLRSGFNFSRTLGAPPPGMQNANVRFIGGGEANLKGSLPPGAMIVRPEAGSATARRVENMTSRLTLGFYHTWHWKDEILVREGVPVLDLLDGSATGGRGGSPRHELELQAGAFKSGLGARVTVKWQSGTKVSGLPAGSGGTPADLSFSAHSTVNINLFANLADRFGGAKAPKWLKGTRVSIGINNLLNSRPEVEDEAGSTPLSYQPAYLDPLGRSVNFSLRKVF